MENAGVDLSEPDCRVGKCGSGNGGSNGVWKANFAIIMLCDGHC